MTVCRSARIWHGWYSSVSALTTGTRLTEAMASMRSWPKVRQTIAAACRSSTRVVSSTGSPPPPLAAAGLAPAGVDDQRVAAELGHADRERDPGARRGLVEQHGHGTGAGQRHGALRRVPRLLQRGGQRQPRRLFGGGEVVVLEEVPGHGVVSIDASRAAGRAAT